MYVCMYTCAVWEQEDTYNLLPYARTRWVSSDLTQKKSNMVGWPLKEGRRDISSHKQKKSEKKKRKEKTLSQILSLHHCQLLRSTIINLPTWNQMPYHTKSLVGSTCPTPLYPSTCLHTTHFICFLFLYLQYLIYN